jgi:hypothetical protein
MKLNYIFNTITVISTLGFFGCKKLLDSPLPTGTIRTSQVFTTDAQATAAANSMYYYMINASIGFANSATSIFAGMSADELMPFDQNGADQFIQFQQNQLVSTNSILDLNFWTNAYSTIYTANAVIEGLQSYSGVHDSVKNELTGEAEFVRAFCNFYLTNLFGDIPLVNTVNWHKTNLLARTPTNQVYESIIIDLKDAQQRLPPDYSVGNGERIIPNKWAATALLARVYLYLRDWANAEAQSTLLINNTNLYQLTTSPKDAFLANSSEAIWQLQQDNNGSSYNATPEGFLLIPFDSTSHPYAYLTTQLLSSFEDKDLRKSSWIDSTIFENTEYYYPYKYKVGPAQATPNGPNSEYYMVLRLAEQYLIRSEARAQQNDIAGGLADLNIIRERALLSDLNISTQSELLPAIAHERQIELFAEWGHRWLDLKRTNQATVILSPIKSQWSNNAILYPLPRVELFTDPNLSQNPGYPN